MIAWPPLPALWMARLARGEPHTPLAWLQLLSLAEALAWGKRVQAQVPPGERMVLWERPEGPQVLARHWAVGEATALHDHQGVAGAEWVLAGTLWFYEHDPMPPHALHSVQAYAEGAQVALDPQVVHQAHNADGATAVTLHVYARPVRSRPYGVGRDGTVGLIDAAVGATTPKA